MIDTHAHLNVENFNHKIHETLDFALKQGVSKIIVIGMDQVSNQKAIDLAQKHPPLYASVGFHPGYLDQELDYVLLEKQLKEDKVVALGECGIDLYWRKDNLEYQKDVFLNQIKLASKTKKPIIIHTRDSFDQTYDVLKPFKNQVTGVFHCFSSTLADAIKVIDLGFYIGIDGPITYKKNTELVELVKAIDIKHILIETDSPYMAPVPYRGKENQPGYVLEVAKKIAEIKNMTVDEVIKVTTQNASKLFNLEGESS